MFHPLDRLMHVCPSILSPGALLQPDLVYQWKHVLLKAPEAQLLVLTEH